jgi:hypothetical protein
MATSNAPARATELLRAVLDDRRHALTPAAIRVERTTARYEGGESRQSALTVWFSEGPALPGPAPAGPSARTVANTVAGIVGVVALGALGVMAAQRQPRLIDAQHGAGCARRLLQSSGAVDAPSDHG